MSPAKRRLLARLDTVIATLGKARDVLAACPMSDAMCETMDGHVRTLATSAGDVVFAMRDTANGAIPGQPGGAA